MKQTSQLKSRAVSSFWQDYRRLPDEVRRAAHKQYRVWLENPQHPSIRFKKVGAFWSARINDDYRTLGIIDDDCVVWFFIGSHAEYDRLLK